MPEKKIRSYKNVGRKTKRPPVEELARLYAEHTTRELSEHYKVSESTVKGWIYYYRHKAPKKEANE